MELYECSICKKKSDDPDDVEFCIECDKEICMNCVDHYEDGIDAVCIKCAE